MTQLEVLNPVAEPVRHSVARAPRRADLRGATIGLYWNMKAGGSDALDRTEVPPQPTPAGCRRRTNFSSAWRRPASAPDPAPGQSAARA